MSAAARRPEAPFGPEEFRAATGVSRETLEKLKLYQQLLEKWSARINLVGRDTLGDSWCRHFLDSAQLYPHLKGHVLADLGSGAGFPGLVLAVIAANEGRPLDTHLIESDQRKAVFLAEVVRATGIVPLVTIHNLRVEDLSTEDLPRADTVTARALAPLSQLIVLSSCIIATGGICLFLKGAKAEAELTAARKTWKMTAEAIPSRSDPSGVLLRLADLARGPTAKR